MVAYNAIPNGDIDAESPITEELIRYLRDNPIAICSSASGAPTVSSSAIADNAIQIPHLIRSEFNLLQQYSKTPEEILSSTGTTTTNLSDPRIVKLAQLWVECISPINGYVVGDIVCIGWPAQVSLGLGLTYSTVLEIGSSATVGIHNLKTTAGSFGTFPLCHASTGADSGATYSAGDGYWKYYFNSHA